MAPSTTVGWLELGAGGFGCHVFEVEWGALVSEWSEPRGGMGGGRG